MNIKSFFVAAAVLVALNFFFTPMAAAESGASTDDVYELILKAVPVIEELGEEGLQAFNDPKGEFVYKDAYVYVIDCSTMTMAAHPAKPMQGADLSDSRDKNPDPAKVKRHGHEMCEISKQPNGGWVEYWWNKLGSEEVARKVSFSIRVPGTNYMLSASIYDDTSDIEKLNASIR